MNKKYYYGDLVILIIFILMLGVLFAFVEVFTFSIAEFESPVGGGIKLTDISEVTLIVSLIISLIFCYFMYKLYLNNKKKRK